MAKLNLYIISSGVMEYGTFSDAIVCAENEDEARMIHPSNDKWNGEGDREWPNAKEVKVELIGKANKNILKGVICASFQGG